MQKCPSIVVECQREWVEFNIQQYISFNDRQNVLCEYVVAQKYMYRPSAFLSARGIKSSHRQQQTKRNRLPAVDLQYETTDLQ